MLSLGGTDGWRGRSIARHLWSVNAVRPSDDLRRESVTNVMGAQNSVWSPIRPNLVVLEECPEHEKHAGYEANQWCPTDGGCFVRERKWVCVVNHVVGRPVAHKVGM